MTTVYFISGANRGIGFSFVKQLSANSNNLVIASARNPDEATELQEWSKENSNTKIVKLDVSNEDSIAGLPDQVSKFTNGIDVLISNAGIATEKSGSILETPTSEFSRLFTVNSIGPVLLVRALRPFLSNKVSSKIIFISSVAGSISSTPTEMVAAYGASKAALNYYMKVLSINLKNDGIIVASFHPGFVSTDMTKRVLKNHGLKEGDETEFGDAKFKVLTPDESVSSILKVVNGLTIKSSGSFLNYGGESLPF